MSLLLLLSALLTPNAYGKPFMQFQYVPNEGGTMLSCEYSQIRDLPDYDVNCGNGEKTFTAHVIVREMPNKEQTAFEILYWITEPGERPTAPRKYHATSAWLKVKDRTALTSVALSQAVENDYASLMLDWRP